jgi:hypothetical protein
MNRKPIAQFDPSSPVLRKAFAVVAIAATLATADFIDALAHGFGTTEATTMAGAPGIVAQRGQV